MSPLMILAFGMAVVLGMILFLRINAFLALLTAAILVSLLAPGEPQHQISRVADAFGGAMASIGIVIALAAVIGQCMMDSGAADRVVRGFLRLLGEKRAPWALLGSGYVLAIPVFFDTVFYLLIPLARSFYRRTGRSFLKCVLAIGAGGAVTHTMVPPTPGPLTIAANLNIDLGYMIGLGCLVALPCAIVALMFGSLLDRILNIPVRAVSDRPEADPIPDEELPPLLLSLLPVVLPVILIAAATATSTLADSEGAARFREGDLKNVAGFKSLVQSADEISPGGQVRKFLPTAALDPNADAAQLQAGLNELLISREFFDPDAFAAVLPASWKVDQQLKNSTDPEERLRLERVQETEALALADVTRLSTAELERRNRLLLETAFPDQVEPHVWKTELRQWANWAALFGNPNFALLLSAGIAIALYVSKRRPTRAEVSQQIEVALMSGGVIILITAAGVSFGKMLEAAQVGPAIQALFTSESGGSSGMTWLLVGFGLSSVLKIAQGSSTAAMIIGSSMLASSVNPAELEFHMAYLALAIASGSLVGCWMNDSGFWVFTKMSGLTEVEGLKAWTTTTAVLGLTGFAMTVLLSRWLPLV